VLLSLMIAGLLACVCNGGSAFAHCEPACGLAPSNYPAQQITLIVPFAASGPTDVVARIVGESMSHTLGQKIVIENVIGAGGTTATRAMRAAPDGHTIMMAHMGTHAAVALYPKLAYTPSTDFAPLGIVAGMPVLILANKDKTLDDGTVRKRLLDLGGDIPDRAERSPEALAALVRSEIARWTSILKSADMTN
jgi:tripartite-type tricarboxylate transporter receptor subunit TctC